MSVSLASQLFAPDFFRDPYPVYRRFREEDPVHWAPDFGFWVLTRHADVAGVMKDPRFTRSLLASASFRRLYDQMPDSPVKADFESSISQIDPPDHHRLKHALLPGFSGTRLERLLEGTRQWTRTLIEHAREEREFDLHAWTLDFSARLIARLLGIPPQDESTFIRDAAELLAANRHGASMEDRMRSMQAMVRIEETVAVVLGRPRIPGVEALLGDLASVLDSREIQTMVRSLLQAGMEPPSIVLDLAVFTLYRIPGLVDSLRRSPERIPAALEEVMRLNHIGRFVQRIAREDLVLAGRTIRKGDMVLAGIAAAHRDPTVFPNPDAFELDRSTAASFPFGCGPFVCVASGLVRMHARVVLSALLEAFPLISFDPGKIRWAPDLFLRKMDEFPVSFRSADR